MKKFASIFLVLMLFSSCEKFPDNPEITRIPGNPNTSFNQHILEGYFVKSIAFDSKDNIWFTSCRVRQGGIVKYDGSNWEVFTPENSDMPVNCVLNIAVDQNDKVWLTLGETVNNSYLTEIAGAHWKTYSSEDLGFAPYYLSEIAVNSHNEVCVGIDYSLSSSWYDLGPQVFVFDGNSSIQLKIDSTRSVNALAVDNEDNIWCTTGQGFAVYNWENWIRNDSIFRGSGSFEIVQAPDNAIWIGTGNGIYINE